MTCVYGSDNDKFKKMPKLYVFKAVKLPVIIAIAIVIEIIFIFQYDTKGDSGNLTLELLKKSYRNQTVYSVLDWTASHSSFKHWYPLFDRIIECGNEIILYYTIKHSELKSADIVAFHLHHMPWRLPKLNEIEIHKQYTVAYTRESEVNSPRRSEWGGMDFNMWCNFNRSYPAPLTYFPNVTKYLQCLLKPPIPFSEKYDVPMAWMCTNCAAKNGRKAFVKELMKYVRIDSMGRCLNNKKGFSRKKYPHGNTDVYKHYKFVIAIENSNCEDYVTEKLLQVLESGAIPIVAGFDGKPNYLKFAPKNSFINVYDFDSIQELGNYINRVASNESLYKMFMKFKLDNENEYNLTEMNKSVLLTLAKERMGPQLFFDELVKVETNENMFCRIAQFLNNRRGEPINRPSHPYPEKREVCLSKNHLSNYFRRRKRPLSAKEVLKNIFFLKGLI